MLNSTDEFGVGVEIVPPHEWSYGAARGMCKDESSEGGGPVIELVARENRSDMATTLVREYAHATLHVDDVDETERSKREVEAESVAYVVGR